MFDSHSMQMGMLSAESFFDKFFSCHSDIVSERCNWYLYSESYSFFLSRFKQNEDYFQYFYFQPWKQL